eukprot:SAG22_NODE_4649_length_1205_cov_0.783906_3_plen_109_part_01
MPVRWYYGCEKFRGFCNKSNTAAQWQQASDAGADGIVVWGESVNTTTLHRLQPGMPGCDQFAQYVTDVVGPAAKARKTDMGIKIVSHVSSAGITTAARFGAPSRNRGT